MGNCKRCMSIIVLAFALIFGGFNGIGLLCDSAYAKDTSKTITAAVYESEEDNAYNFSSAIPDSSAKAAGSLVVSGDFNKISEEDGVTIFSVNPKYDKTNNGLSVTYTYSDILLDAADESWHLVEDKDKKVDTISLNDRILNGAIILQTSKDGEIWVTDYAETNIFASVPNRTEAFYTATDMQILNGCYYRVIVAYELSRKGDLSKFLFISRDKHENKKCVEVYEFYAYDETAAIATINDNTKKYNLGSKVRTDKYEGYYGTATIKSKDPHYGWNLGQFFVSGYTDSVKDADSNIVFLKNAGDRVTLWFKLEQDINCLNHNDSITIMDDPAGFDQYFETPPTDFGHGALIVRKTNYENVTEKPQIYTNYLEAVATAGTNTKVDLFEEGDYEVALDYAINYDKTKVLGKPVLSEQAHYRIYFRFSVRNSNSMFFPRDAKTTSELANNAITANGFYLDLANSKYLQLNIVRQVLKDGAGGLSEDVRFNKSAKEGDLYTDEGIYTITVTNIYTGKSTTKQICVGENNILRAYMVTGISISEIKDKLAAGATIADDGTIIEPISATAETQQTEEPAEEENEIKETDTSTGLKPTETVSFTIEETDSGDEVADIKTKLNPVLMFSLVLIVAATVFFAVRSNKENANKDDNEGE